MCDVTSYLLPSAFVAIGVGYMVFVICMIFKPDKAWEADYRTERLRNRELYKQIQHLRREARKIQIEKEIDQHDDNNSNRNKDSNRYYPPPPSREV